MRFLDKQSSFFMSLLIQRHFIFRLHCGLNSFFSSFLFRQNSLFVKLENQVGALLLRFFRCYDICLLTVDPKFFSKKCSRKKKRQPFDDVIELLLPGSLPIFIDDSWRAENSFRNQSSRESFFRCCCERRRCFSLPASAGRFDGFIRGILF